jgi:hypothetical protein
MAQPLFLFVQFEFPWPLGIPDGRYLLRAGRDGEPEHVVVLRTLKAPAGAAAAGHRRGLGRLRGNAPSRLPGIPPEPEPAPVARMRATVVDPISLAAERQARAWLASLDPDHDVVSAAEVLNRILYAHRIASADPYAREVSATQATRIRAGWGEGEQVAEGRWLHAVELGAGELHGGEGKGRLRRRRRSAALRPQERLARLLSAREQPLLCEELALRARLDLENGRVGHAALELERAYSAALVELAGERRGDLPLRVAELGSLREGVALAAQAVLPETPTEVGTAAGKAGEESPVATGASAVRTGEGAASPSVQSATHAGSGELDEEVIEHALGRLEAALRARSAAGFEGV